MFSQLRRFDLRDEQGRRARLEDVAVGLLDADPNCSSLAQRNNDALCLGLGYKVLIAEPGRYQ
ncbi:MAG TPA: hypothetical protein VJ180_07695 [Pyrinomonadaceae bacterium]|nr:hypothetical protein [Pyrinomonadaceae bacterium]